LVKTQIQPLTELESSLLDHPSLNEAEPFMQYDAASVGGIDPSYHRVNVTCDSLVYEFLH